MAAHTPKPKPDTDGSEPKTDGPAKPMYARRDHAPDEIRTGEITSGTLDRVEQLHLAWPARLNDTPGRQRMVSVHHWTDAILEWALPVWEAQAQQAFGHAIVELGRAPRPAELAARITPTGDTPPSTGPGLLS